MLSCHRFFFCHSSSAEIHTHGKHLEQRNLYQLQFVISSVTCTYQCLLKVFKSPSLQLCCNPEIQGYTLHCSLKKDLRPVVAEASTCILKIANSNSLVCFTIYCEIIFYFNEQNCIYQVTTCVIIVQFCLLYNSFV